ncbi:ydjO [Escherichia coli]|nr:ydjO [Escherichia coli]SQN95380.1 ydjO [Escherichia coli]SQO00615.1 ydjO [Escherichia coli]
MMSLWDALRMNMMISYQELVRTFPNGHFAVKPFTVFYRPDNLFSNVNSP